MSQIKKSALSVTTVVRFFYGGSWKVDRPMVLVYIHFNVEVSNYIKTRTTEKKTSCRAGLLPNLSVMLETRPSVTKI